MKQLLTKGIVFLACLVINTTTAVAQGSVNAASRVTGYKLKVLSEYPHSTDAYTQGLFFHDGNLYESTGQYGASTFRVLDLKAGTSQVRLNFNRKYFGEGSVILGDKLYVLTWTNRIAFVYDASTFKYLQAYTYPREGWGLTTDGRSLIASDGSDKLYWLAPDFKLLRTVAVRLNGRAVRLLNELEMVDGKIWANVYTTDKILIINPDSGVVEAIIDCSCLLPDRLRKPSTDVLNGIAVDPSDGAVYLTGKNWPRIYKVALVKQ